MNSVYYRPKFRSFEKPQTRSHIFTPVCPVLFTGGGSKMAIKTPRLDGKNPPPPFLEGEPPPRLDWRTPHPGDSSAFGISRVYTCGPVRILLAMHS